MTHAEKQAKLNDLNTQRRRLAQTIQDGDDELVLAREALYEAQQMYLRMLAQAELPELTEDVLSDFTPIAWRTYGPSFHPGDVSWIWWKRSVMLDFVQEAITNARNQIATWTRRLAAWTTQLAALDAQINALLAEIQKQLEAQRAAQEEAAPTPPAAPPTPPKPKPAPKPKAPPKPKPSEEKERTLEKIYGASKRSRQKK